MAKNLKYFENWNIMINEILWDMKYHEKWNIVRNKILWELKYSQVRTASHWGRLMVCGMTRSAVRSSSSSARRQSESGALLLAQICPDTVLWLVGIRMLQFLPFAVSLWQRKAVVTIIRMSTNQSTVSRQVPTNESAPLCLKADSDQTGVTGGSQACSCDSGWRWNIF